MKKIGLGADFTDDNKQHNIKIIRTAMDLGVNLIDTAEIYSDGNSEKTVGEAIRGNRDKIFISTKFSPSNSSYSKIIQSCERSLQRLNTDRIDLYQVHWPYPDSNEQIANAFYELKKSGKIVNHGVSNYNKQDLDNFTKYIDKTFSNQIEYNLFDKHVENEIFEFCNNNSMKIIAYSPLNKGREILKNKAVLKLSEKYGRSPSQILLNWLINKNNVIVIPKTTKVKNLILNCSSDDFTMDDGDYNLLNEYRKTVYAIEPFKIEVSVNGENNRKVYTTIEQATKNNMNLCPSPMELSKIIGDKIKPVRIITKNNKYFLVEGRVRYWAWVLKNGFEKPIPSLIYKEFEK
jgi:diketogulonate reductase-like aldo/keto reductase